MAAPTDIELVKAFQAGAKPLVDRLAAEGAKTVDGPAGILYTFVNDPTNPVGLKIIASVKVDAPTATS